MLIFMIKITFNLDLSDYVKLQFWIWGESLVCSSIDAIEVTDCYLCKSYMTFGKKFSCQICASLYCFVLGVAFEQGKILPTPETVPFRLTRDIVDGMGITGVEGVFRR